MHTVNLDLTVFHSSYKYCQRALTLLTYKHTPVDSVAKPGAGYMSFVTSQVKGHFDGWEAR